ncbi:MAG: CTP synthase [Patescibacteria group bacterium]|nr:CTP synthase [Patescibacteria group bacterium]
MARKPAKKILNRTKARRAQAASRPSHKKAKSPHKYIFVIGGVMSGVGKGVATASLGTLLSAKGFKVNLVKVDPYLNVDAGTMNPTEHGEVFVLDSGLETDQDMGNYERFLGRDLTADDYLTSGMVYKSVIDRERALGYGGKCVEAIPQIRDEIVGRYERAAKINGSDISIIEVGGTIGDYQNIMFIEAARVLKIRHPHDVVFMVVSYLPTPGTLGEMKTRPTQNAINQLSSYGVTTDIVIARAATPLDQRRKEKIATACNILPKRVISAPDIESIYDVPVNFDKDKLADIVLEALDCPEPPHQPQLDMNEWRKMARGIKDHAEHEVHIGVVGKYFNTGDFILSDAYISVLEAIKFSAYANKVKAVIHTVNARDFEIAANGEGFAALDKLDGIIVPGGFGSSGIEGKLAVIKYAREKKIPYLGLCYGMQLMTIEYARDVLKLDNAHTTEIDPKTPHPIIDIMPDQREKMARGDYGGTMRLGLYPAKLSKDTIAQEAYSYFNGKKLPKATTSIKERHRHRYEVNPKYIERLEKAGLVFSGRSPDGRLMEIAELPRDKHPFFLGTQFHPEFLARPLMPHPLFTEFVKAAKERKGRISN